MYRLAPGAWETAFCPASHSSPRTLSFRSLDVSDVPAALRKHPGGRFHPPQPVLGS